MIKTLDTKYIEDKGKIDSTMKVKDCVKLWMVQVVKIKNEGSTIDDKISKLTNHFLPYLGNLQMCDVKRNDIQDWIVTLTDKKSMRYNDGTFEKLSPTTIHNVYSIVRAFFNWASDEDINIINMTPCRKIELPKRKDYEKEILEDKNDEDSLIKIRTVIDTFFQKKEAGIRLCSHRFTVFRLSDSDFIKLLSYSFPSKQ